MFRRRGTWVIHVPRTRLCRSRPFGLKKVRLSATTLRGSLRRLVISSTAVSLPLIRCKMSEKSWKVSALTVTVTSMTPPCSLRSFASMQLIPMSKKSTEDTTKSTHNFQNFRSECSHGQSYKNSPPWQSLQNWPTGIQYL